MKKVLLAVSLVFTLLVTACGSPQAAAPTLAPTVALPTMPAATQAPATTAPTSQVPVTGSQAQLALGNSAALGPLLVDDKGMTLYLFEKDTQGSGASTCYDKCAANWPALLTNGAPAAGAGLDASLLGTIQRTDGTTQVTYNGWPLYHYAQDSQAGDTNGQGVGDIWFVVTADGNPGPAAAAAPAAPPAATMPAATTAPYSPY